MKKIIMWTMAWWSLASAHASASTISFQGEGKAGVVEIRSDGFPSGVWTYAGELNWSWVGVPPDGFTSSWLYTYCIGADEYLLSQQTVSAGSTDGLTMSGVTAPGSKVAWLLNTYAPGILAAGTGSDAAALQVAIWEALYDNDGDLSTGRFQLLTANDSHVRTMAEAYMASLMSSSYGDASAIWLDTPAHGGQDQLALVPVAEPASLVLLGLGAVAACGWRHRSRLRHGLQSCVRQTSRPTDTRA